MPFEMTNHLANDFNLGNMFLSVLITQN